MNDNLGLLIAGIFRSPTTANKLVSNLKSTSALIFNTRIYSTQADTNRWNFDGVFRQVQVGKGTTPATRQDFNIESPFVVAPESGLNNSINGVYNSGLGKINQATLIAPTGGAGTITEVIKVFRARATVDQTAKTIVMFRDIISSVGFIIGESINIDHEVFI